MISDADTDGKAFENLEIYVYVSKIQKAFGTI